MASRKHATRLRVDRRRWKDCGCRSAASRGRDDVAPKFAITLLHHDKQRRDLQRCCGAPESGRTGARTIATPDRYSRNCRVAALPEKLRYPRSTRLFTTKETDRQTQRH